MKPLPLQSVFLFALLAALVLPAAAEVRTPAEVARAVDQHYNRLRTLQARFTESYRGMGMARTESGTVWLKKPGRMRWEYATPRPKLFVTDGKTAYFYLPEDRQARRAPVKQLDDLRSPLRFLLGKARLEEELERLTLVPSVSTPGHVILRGTPKSFADRIALVELEISPASQILRLLIEEVDGSLTEFLFRDLVENSPLADERFRFSPPAGVEVIETSDLAP